VNVAKAQAALAAAEQAVKAARHQLADALAADGWWLMSSHQMPDGSLTSAVYVRTLPDGTIETQRLEGILEEAAA
jgi:hypothetical protein